jgi:hypothetical protein
VGHFSIGDPGSVLHRRLQPSGGRIIVHDMLLNPDGAGPALVADYNVTMALWTEGQQYTARELGGILAEAGFANIKSKRTMGYWGIVSGQKK